MMRILVIGRNGQLGGELTRALALVAEVTALGREQLDLASPDSIRRALRLHPAELIINAAAYTAVDRAEQEPELAMQINAHAPALMAEEARRSGAAFLSYSSDYVFDGAKQGSYVESDEPNPLNSYGRSKLAGERAIVASGGIVLRTSWLYGARGSNFLLTMLRLRQQQQELRVVNDQFGAPTASRHLAQATAQMVQACSAGKAQGAALRERSGVYHATAAGEASWYEFACAIFAACNSQQPTPCRLLPISSSEYLCRARRPLNSRLDNGRLRDVFGIQLPAWQQGLRETLRELQSEKFVLTNSVATDNSRLFTAAAGWPRPIDPARQSPG